MKALNNLFNSKETILMHAKIENIFRTFSDRLLANVDKQSVPESVQRINNRT